MRHRRDKSRAARRRIEARHGAFGFSVPDGLEVDGVRDPRMEILAKPFSMAALGNKVREMLEA